MERTVRNKNTWVSLFHSANEAFGAPVHVLPLRQSRHSCSFPTKVLLLPHILIAETFLSCCFFLAMPCKIGRWSSPSPKHTELSVSTNVCSSATDISYRYCMWKLGEIFQTQIFDNFSFYCKCISVPNISYWFYLQLITSIGIGPKKNPQYRLTPNLNS